MRKLSAVALVASAVLLASPARALFEDNEARVALNALRKDVVAMQAQVARLEESQKANLAVSDQMATLGRNLATLSGRLEVLENRIAQQEKNARELYEDLDARIRKFEPQSINIGGKSVEVSQTEKASYENGIAAFQAGRYSEAANSLGTLLTKYPNSAYAPEAMYWQGNAYFALQNYKRAASVEDRLIKRYPKDKRIPDAMLSLASAQTALGNLKAASDTLAALRKRYPKTEQAKLAAQRAKDLEAALQ